MAETKVYVGLGEEAARGTAEVTTVSFLPLSAMPKVEPEFKDDQRKQVRGEPAVLGAQAFRRMSQSWKGSLPVEFYSEGGGAAKTAYSVLLKHLFGKANDAQNGATGQYYHMCYPHTDPFGAGSVAAKGLSVNVNSPQAATMKNYPFVGGRVKALTLTQEPGQPLKGEFELFGQKLDTVTAELGSPAFPAENLRMQYTNFKLYTGTITRTGTGPDFTQFAFGSATLLTPDKFSLKIEAPFEDNLRLAGVNYPDKTRISGAFKATLELTFDMSYVSGGFSSVAEFVAWLADVSTTNFAALWDTSVQAGTGDNHMLIADMPVMVRQGGMPEFDLEKDPMVTLKYEAQYDATTCKYLIGMMLKNTAATS